MARAIHPETFAVDAEGSGDSVTKELPKAMAEMLGKSAMKNNFGGDSA